MTHEKPGETFGERLAVIRKEANVKLTQLGGAIGVTAGQVSHWEHGRGYPNAEHIRRIALFLACDLDYLILGIRKVRIDITDMWPGNIAAVKATVSIVQQNEISRDAAWPAFYQKLMQHQDDSIPDPPWYDDLR